MSETEVLFHISCISVVKYQIKLRIMAIEQTGKDSHPMADGAYEFTYHYDAESEMYMLKRIKRGIALFKDKPGITD